MSNHDELAVDYLAALERYLGQPDETGRAQAYELGHRAVEARLGLIDFLGIHRSAIESLMAHDPLTPSAVSAAIDFFTESLSTFDMAQRGYWEAQERAAIDHAIAVTLQRSLLPHELPETPGLDVAVRYLPAGRQAKVGGDWYDVVQLDGDRVVLVVGDVMGHGVRQASVMGQLRLGFRAYLAEGHPLAAVVARSDHLLHTLGDVHTATLSVVSIDVRAAAYSVLGAGHPPPIHLRAEGGASFVEGGHGRLLGLPGTVERSLDGPHPLAVGDLVLLYTDGLLEERERSGERGMDALLEIADGFVGSPDKLCDVVIEALVGESSGDDVCLLAARLEAPPAEGSGSTG